LKDKSVLGKGLDALITDKNSSNAENLYVGIHKITPNPEQPRKDFSERGIDELSKSIIEKGMIQPIIVRKSYGRYQIIAGERRWRAAQKAGLKSIPVIIKEVSDIELLELALIENIQREDLNPIEEACAYETLVVKFQLTHDEIANKIGKDRTTITNHLRLLKLPEEVKKALIMDEISQGHARALLSIHDEKLIINLLKIIISKRLSVRKTEELVSKSVNSIPEKIQEISKVDLNMKFYTDQLKKHLGTGVRITRKKDKGKIEIDYFSNEDLNRLLKILLQ
jgi:ParB family transcriptional regulator, chromosome partitioning protein